MFLGNKSARASVDLSKDLGKSKIAREGTQRTDRAKERRKEKERKQKKEPTKDHYFLTRRLLMNFIENCDLYRVSR